MDSPKNILMMEEQDIGPNLWN